MASKVDRSLLATAAGQTFVWIGTSPAPLRLITILWIDPVDFRGMVTLTIDRYDKISIENDMEQKFDRLLWKMIP